MAARLMFRRAAGPGWPAPAGWAACQRHGQRTRGTWPADGAGWRTGPAHRPADGMGAGRAGASGTAGGGTAGGRRASGMGRRRAAWAAGGTGGGVGRASWMGRQGKMFRPTSGMASASGMGSRAKCPRASGMGAAGDGPSLTGPPAAGPVSPVPAGMDRARPRSGAPPPAGETPAPANRPAAPRNRRPWGEARCLRAPKARPPPPRKQPPDHQRGGGAAVPARKTGSPPASAAPPSDHRTGQGGGARRGGRAAGASAARPPGRGCRAARGRPRTPPPGPGRILSGPGPARRRRASRGRSAAVQRKKRWRCPGRRKAGPPEDSAAVRVADSGPARKCGGSGRPGRAGEGAPPRGWAGDASETNMKRNVSAHPRVRTAARELPAAGAGFPPHPRGWTGAGRFAPLCENLRLRSNVFCSGLDFFRGLCTISIGIPIHRPQYRIAGA